MLWLVLRVLLMNDDSSFDATMGRDGLTIAVGVTWSAGSYLHLVLLCFGDNCSDAVHDLGVEKGNEKRIEESPAFMYYQQRTKLGCLSTVPGPQCLLPSQVAVEQHHPIHVIANSDGGCILRRP